MNYQKYTGEYDSIVLRLKRTPTAIAKDRNTFSDWVFKIIPLEICINQFKDNNDIAENVDFDKELFTKWLNSLGYRRDEQE